MIENTVFGSYEDRKHLLFLSIMLSSQIALPVDKGRTTNFL